ncbi:PHD and RING finger domain-containing protein 1 [Linum grandiflorum]
MSPGRVLHSIVPHNAEDSIPSAFLPTHQLSTVTSLSEIRSPNLLVYRRRKLSQPETAPHCPKALSVALVYQRRNLSQPDSAAVFSRRKLSQGHTRASHSEGTAHSVHESCSSSRSNVDFISASNNKEVDDTASETLGKGASERDICISILVRHGVIKRVWPSSTRTHRGVRIGGHGCKLCNVCSRSDSTGRMLICDDCEEAFHLSCCSPRIKAIPVDEWLCHICLRKNRKAVKETSKCHNISDGAVGSLKAVSGSGASPIELMLTDTEPYTTGVRVGKGFQAEVPDWSGPAL